MCRDDGQVPPDVAGGPVRKEEAEPHLEPGTFSANNDLQNLGDGSSRRPWDDDDVVRSALKSTAATFIAQWLREGAAELRDCPISASRVSPSGISEHDRPAGFRRELSL